MPWLERAVDSALTPFRKLMFRLARARLVRCLESGVLDAFLELLLKAMSLAFRLDHAYGRNIDGFKVTYTFRSRDSSIGASAVFADGRMHVRRRAAPDADITITFKDGRALRDFLFTENPDIIAAILDNEVSYVGNLNYLGKFAYMAKHLQLRFCPP